MKPNTPNRWTRFVLICLCGLGPVLVSGCAAAPLSVVGAATSVGRAGMSTFRSGKLETVELVRFEPMCDAVDAAIAELSLNIRRSKMEDGRRYTVWTRDDNGSPVTIQVLRKTETMTRVRIDVGWFGSESTARLALRRVHAALVARGVLKIEELPGEP